MRPVLPVAAHEQIRIGARLRAARNAQRLTLEQLAQAAGLSRGFLSRVENDATSPSVATLIQICQVLSVPVGNLFAEPELQHITLDSAPLINLGGENLQERLISPRNESRVQVIRSRAEPFATGGEALYTVNCEVETLHILAGNIDLRFTHSSFAMKTGDSITFAGNEPHTWNAHDEGAELLWVLVPAAWSGTS